MQSHRSGCLRNKQKVGGDDLTGVFALLLAPVVTNTSITLSPVKSRMLTLRYRRYSSLQMRTILPMPTK